MDRSATAIDFEATTGVFYTKLIDACPDLEKIFRDPVKQHSMFALALESLFTHLARPNSLDDLLKKFGEVHQGMALQDSHLEAGRKAFREALVEANPSLEGAYAQELFAAFEIVLQKMEITKPGS